MDTPEPIKTGPGYIIIGISIVIFIILFSIGYQLVNYKKIKDNWNEYRCDLSIIPVASFYGKDANENFDYCMKHMIATKAGSFLGPLAPIITSIIGAMMNLIDTINSVRLEFATMFGGINMFFNEFTQRINLIFNQIKITGVRMQFLFNRLFSTFFSIIFMGSSAITAGTNFGDTVLFSFLDLFCFDPVTLIDISGKGVISVADVKLGDVCSADGSIITSVYRFYSRGQPMVKFDGTHGQITVSTNHYMKNNEDNWIRCEDHDDAVENGLWESDKPLVCFDTNTHRIPIGGYVFSDYDETNTSDAPTMKLIDTLLNNTSIENLPNQYDWPYMPCLHPSTPIMLKDGTTKNLSEITIGTELKLGRVIGLVMRKVDRIVNYNDTWMTPSTSVWIAETSQWMRAGFLEHVHISPEGVTMMMPIVMSTCSIETANGLVVRDFLEILSHDIEGPTAETLLSCPKKASADSV